MGYHATRVNSSRQIERYKKKLYPSLLLQGRGISKTSIQDDLQPVPEGPEESSRFSHYGRSSHARKRDSFNEFTFNDVRIDSPLPLESEQSSMRDDLDSSRYHSELSDSNMWSVCTGNLTGRSSVNSWGNDDEFDRQASATVRRMFDEIDELLFEESSTQGSDPLTTECKEWSITFPHMRIIGSQLLSLEDSGTQIISVNHCDDKLGAQIHRPDTAITAISLDDVRTETLHANFNGLSICGLKVEPTSPPLHVSFSNDDDNGCNPYSHLKEEIYAEDGDLEEYFAYDTDYVEFWDTAKKERKNKRNKQYGYPPVTPNASATDSLASETFDHLWEEVVQSVRGLLIAFIDRTAREYGKNLLQPHPRNIENSSVRTLSRDSSSRAGAFSSQNGFKSLYGSSQASNTVGLNELMLIRSLSLRQRETPNATMLPRDEESVPPMLRDQLRPVSGNIHSSKVFQGGINSHHSDHQLYGKVSTGKTYKRLGRLQPLQPMDRTKTPASMENDAVGGMVIGTRLHTAGDHRLSISNMPTFSPQLWGGKSGTLPPIERMDTSETLCNLPKDRTRSPKQHLSPFSKRASSAATNETRRSSHRNKITVLPDSRPNTTHTFRSETPVSDSSKRPQVHEKVSNLSAAGSGISAISDHSENTIGVLHGVSLPLGTQQNQTSKTVSFDDDAEEFNEFTIWGNGTPVLNQQHQRRRRPNVR